MELTKKDKTIKYAVYAVIILFASLLQNVSGLWFTIGGARCFFLIPVCVLLGINEDELISALLGLFAGLLWDCVSVSHMGFNSIYLMIACYVSAALVVFLFRNTFLLGIIEGAVAIIAYILIYWILFVLIKSSEGAGLAFAKFYLPSMIYTLAMTPLIYLLISPIKDKLNKANQLEK